MVHETKKNKTQHNRYWTPLCAKYTNSVSKTGSLLQTTRDKDEHFMRKLQQTPNVNTHKRTTQITKKISNLTKKTPE